MNGRVIGCILASLLVVTMLTTSSWANHERAISGAISDFGQAELGKGDLG